jgi:uncharacterized membrane protein
MKTNKYLIIIIICIAFQGVLSVFLINQSINFQSKVRDMVDNNNKSALTNEKLRTNYEYILTNNIGAYENTKEWRQYSDSRIMLGQYNLEDVNTSPIMQIR